MDSVISTGFQSACDQSAEARQVRSYNEFEAKSKTAARNPCNVEMRMLKRGWGDFRVFSPPPVLAAAPPPRLPA